MIYIFQFCRILGFCFAGELCSRLLPLPIPASIYGLVLLVLAPDMVQYVTLLPKSVTTAISLDVSEALGGIAALLCPVFAGFLG